MKLSSILKQRAPRDWLIGYDWQKGDRLLAEFSQMIGNRELRNGNRGGNGKSSDSRLVPPTILLVADDPMEFIAGFLASLLHHCPVFLANPNWREAEWQEVFNLVQPDLVFGKSPIQKYGEKYAIAQPNYGEIMIPTGGSSGKIRFVRHTWQTLTASVRGFC
ncbi:MAG: hypothetical protein F6K24_31815, partial [Okeania sp. SIO2D1]|nr:hypothetical protein [Okeania sp. SIO2D1]